MFSYAVQQEDIDILRQSERITYAKVELLNASKQIVNTIEGQIFNDNLSLDGDSAVRRTYTCDIVVSDEMFLVGKDKNIWADRLIRVYYGIKHNRTKEIMWYRLGTFSYVDVSYSFSTTQKMLSITCHDMMANYNGTKSGVIVYDVEDKAIFKAEVDQKYSDVIIGLCNTAGIKDYNITGLDGYVVPYDLEFGITATYYEVWQKLSELYPGKWEFFFDEDGTFVWQKKPSGLNENIVLDDTILHNIIISENINDTFQNIYNVTEVWGQELDVVDDDRYATACTGGTSASDTVFDITIPGVTAMTDIDNFTNIAVTVSGAYGRYIRINNLETVPIINSAGDGPFDQTLVANTLYVFRYRRTRIDTEGESHNFYLLGQFQAHGYYEEQSVNVPYSVPNLGYKAVKVIENTSLYCDEVCQNQAEYETYQTTAKQDSISLQCIIIPFIEPNTKVRYTPFMTEEPNEYIIKKISWSSMSGVMSMDLYRFLEDYKYVYDRAHDEG